MAVNYIGRTCFVVFFSSSMNIGLKGRILANWRKSAMNWCRFGIRSWSIAFSWAGTIRRSSPSKTAPDSTGSLKTFRLCSWIRSCHPYLESWGRMYSTAEKKGGSRRAWTSSLGSSTREPCWGRPCKEWPSLRTSNLPKRSRYRRSLGFIPSSRPGSTRSSRIRCWRSTWVKLMKA